MLFIRRFLVAWNLYRQHRYTPAYSWQHAGEIVSGEIIK